MAYFERYVEVQKMRNGWDPGEVHSWTHEQVMKWEQTLKYEHVDVKQKVLQNNSSALVQRLSHLHFRALPTIRYTLFLNIDPDPQHTILRL
jgi:hypothetical protein